VADALKATDKDIAQAREASLERAKLFRWQPCKDMFVNAVKEAAKL